MPLSEYEQRVLEQMERQLTSDDPRLANTLTQRGHRPFGRYVIAGVGASVGLLLRAGEDGQIKRALVSGRVLYHERIRAALLRHVEKDLGPLALPRVPPAPQPFAVAEYFPTPGVTPFHDPRQHAVSLAYVVPIEGDCAPQQDALELTWFSPDEARDPAVLVELMHGQSTLLLQALAHLGV